MPIPAIIAALGPLLGGGGGAAAAGARVAASGASSGAAATGARVAAGEAGAASKGAQAASQTGKVDKFHALFGEKADGSPLPADQNPHLPKPEEAQKGPDKLQATLKSLNQFDQSISKLADKSAQVADGIENAANNRFLPILRDVLPEQLGKLVDSVARVVTSFVDRGKELSGLSGELAAANAIVGVKNLQADLKEANELGGGIAQMTTGANDIWLSIREILLPIKRLLVDQLGSTLQRAGDAAVLIADVVGPIVDILSSIAGGVVDVVKWINPINQIIGLLSFIKRNTEKDDKDRDKDELDKLIEKANQLKQGIGNEKFRRDGGPAPQPPLNLGLFAGL